MKDTKTSKKNSQIDKITTKRKGSKIKRKSGEKGHKKDKAVGQKKCMRIRKKTRENAAVYEVHQTHTELEKYCVKFLLLIAES